MKKRTLQQKWTEPLQQGAKCLECPLVNQSIPVPSTIRRSSLAIITDYPSKASEITGKSLSGWDRYFVNDIVGKDAYSSIHTLLCRPPKGFKEYDRAMACCEPRLKRDLQSAQAKGLLIAGPLGLKSLTQKTRITAYYGAPIETPFGAALPTIPFRDVRNKSAWRVVVIRWIKRAMALSQGKLKPWKWPELVIGGERFRSALDQLIGDRLPIAIDIENIPDTGKIRCIGVANKNIAISVPLMENRPDEAIIDQLREVLACSLPKVFHYGAHDILELRAAGWTLNGAFHDTLLQHAVAYPKLSHKLTDVACFETYSDRWKTAFKVEGEDKGGDSDRFTSAPIDELLLYNAKDAAMTAHLFDILESQIHTSVYKGPELYANSLLLDALGQKMKTKGILVNTGRKAYWDDTIAKEMLALNADFVALNPPTGIALGANGQNPGNARLFFTHFNQTPLVYSEETGNPSLDTKTLSKYATTEGGVGFVAKVSRLVLRYRRLAKLRTSYITNMPSDEANLIHPTWKITGTRTGRWSAIRPAVQTTPKNKKNRPGMRELFMARSGCVMVEADYSQLELRIVALLAGDKKLLEWYARGEDVHTLNAREVFGTPTPTENDRNLAKSVVYGLNYGGSAETIWQALLPDNPGLPLANVVRVVKTWFESHPEIKEWQNLQVALAEERKYVEAPLSGRRQYYEDGEIQPTEVLNFPIQATAGDLMNRAALEIDKALDWTRESFLLQVHDAAILEGPDQARLIGILKGCMEQEVELNGHKTMFPVDVKAGPDWGHLEKVKC